MKIFLKKIFLFFLPALLLLYPADLLISYGLKKSHRHAGEMEVWNDIFQGKANCDIAIYGSSRAWIHFNTPMMSRALGRKVYNFGLDGHNFWMQYLRHRELLKFNKAPQTIILSLDDLTLEKRKDLYGLAQFLPYMLWDKEIQAFTGSYLGFGAADYTLPLLRYTSEWKPVAESMVNLVYPQSTQYRELGYRPHSEAWNSDFDKARAKIGRYHVRVDTASLKLLNQFLKECKVSGTGVVLAYSPEYIEGQQFVENREDIKNIYAVVAAEHHLPFLDYSSSSICQEKSLFYNAMHLNKKGSDLFTKTFIEDFRKLEERQLAGL